MVESDPIQTAKKRSTLVTAHLHPPSSIKVDFLLPEDDDDDAGTKFR